MTAVVPGPARACIVLMWTYQPDHGPNTDAVLQAIVGSLGFPDGVHAYAAIGETAEKILACFDEDAH